MPFKHFAALALLTAAIPAQAARYTAERFAILGLGLGEDGTVIGQTADALLPVVRHPDGSFETLPTLGGSRGAALAINAAGTIVGGARTGADGASTAPFVRSGGMTTAIPVPSGARFGYADDINDAGVAAGTYNPDRRSSRAFRWSADTGTTLLDVPEGYDSTIARSINSLGTIGGEAFSSNVPFRLVRWAADGSASLLTQVGDGDSFGALNDAGTIAGGSFRSDPFTTRGTVWNPDGTTVDVGTLAGDNYSFLTDINSFGVALGYSGDADNFGEVTGVHLVQWTAAAGLRAIDFDFGANYTVVNSQRINDAGQILVAGLDAGGSDLAVLLTPAAGVPEPASWVMLLSGFAVVGASLRRRQGAVA